LNPNLITFSKFRFNFFLKISPKFNQFWSKKVCVECGCILNSCGTARPGWRVTFCENACKPKFVKIYTILQYCCYYFLIIPY